MTGWLWLVAVLAIVWPVVWTHFAEGSMLKNIETEVRNHEGSYHTNDMSARVDALNKRVEILTDFIETNDTLLAALWERSYGHDQSEGGYTDLGYVSTTYDRLKRSWGVRPDWFVEKDQVSFEFNYLKRDGSYPWNSNAPWLRDEGNR